MNLIRLSNGLALPEAQMDFLFFFRCEVLAGWAFWCGFILLGVPGRGISLLVTLSGGAGLWRGDIAAYCRL